MIKTLIFDNNGVLVTSNEETGFNAISTEIGLDMDRFRPIYNKLAESVDDGKITSKTFFEKLITECSLELNPAELQNTIYSTFVRKEDTITFVRELRKSYEVALLTNFGDAFWELDKKWRVTELFDKDKVFLSCDMKTRKPLEDIYLKVLNSLDRKPKEVVFIDDKNENVKAAEKLGINGIVFRNLSSLKQELKKYITIE